MSKGGAGKVYFVLYLAVILELLIIIVERDEAEEHLIRKQKEAEEIVEAVMAQLNTGSGSSGVNALPQDEITLLDPRTIQGVAEKDKPKDERTYQIRVSTVRVKDILGDALPDEAVAKERRIEEIIRLFNVSNLTLIDSLNSTSLVENLTLDLNKEWLKNKTKEIMGKLGGKNTITDIPEYKDGLSFLRTIVPDSMDYTSNSTMLTFRFSPHLTLSDKSQFENGIKVFEYTFKQTNPGLFKVMLQSKTNNIIGVSGLGKEGEGSENDVVSIGTIQLTRKQLAKVAKRLRSTLGSTVETICDKFATTSEYKYVQFSKDLEEAIEKINHEDIGLPSKSDKIRRGELLKNITVLLHGDANQMEQNNPVFQFEINVKKPNIATADPCIADLVKAQRVLSGIKKVVIPLTVNNFRNETPQVSITPSDATVRVVPLGSGTSSGSLRNQPFEIHIEGVRTGDARKDYTVKITNLKMCDDTEPSAVVSVFPADLKNKSSIESVMDKRVMIGKPVRLPIEPSSGGDIQSNQFVLSYTLDGQKTEIPGTTPLQITVPCVPKSMSSLNVEVKWVYRPLGSQYTEEVVLFQKSVASAKQSSPEILMTGTTELFDAKALKFTLSGIEVIPPRVDCNVTAQERDVKVDAKLDKPSVGKFTVFATTEPEGGGRYRVVLQLKGPKMKFPGENVDITITATVGGVSISETKTVTIPEFR
ncbi:MAG TPA: hypothetical protein DIS79_01310 [Bacteroidetes bacterium]|nr:hypothetical protein [Bacteroidota bacterium]HRK04646.1 hypothetical protein [Chlorobiota bacterium]